MLYYGAKGIGLLRSEFQYLGRENYPRENELFRAYKKVAETMGERLAVIRTADLGAQISRHLIWTFRRRPIRSWVTAESSLSGSKN